jgi:predicted metal-dependent hydrolase
MTLGGESIPVLFVRHRRARRYLLRVRPDGTLRVTLPWSGSLESAWGFAERQVAWIRRQRELRAAAPPARKREWRVGTAVMFRGVAVPLTVQEDGSGWVLDWAGLRVPISGVEGDLRATVEQALWRLAWAELPGRVGALAAEHGLTVRRVTVRNQRSRWGSCSRRGTVSLNWRLVQVPERVRDYVIVHELMHLWHMNHSPAFWATVAAACPDYLEARAWLRSQEALLR